RPRPPDLRAHDRRRRRHAERDHGELPERPHVPEPSARAWTATPWHLLRAHARRLGPHPPLALARLRGLAAAPPRRRFTRLLTALRARPLRFTARCASS